MPEINDLQALLLERGINFFTAPVSAVLRGIKEIRAVIDRPYRTVRPLTTETRICPEHANRLGMGAKLF